MLKSKPRQNFTRKETKSFIPREWVLYYYAQVLRVLCHKPWHASLISIYFWSSRRLLLRFFRVCDHISSVVLLVVSSFVREKSLEFRVIGISYIEKRKT
ncbi:unnamed protein product [Amoebophrya sp. A25]|nr:unnamed protein product [Amoebophrya sp. A25]|eukprot:GSA25T00011148001.1